jgi:hypothetical protein
MWQLVAQQWILLAVAVSACVIVGVLVTDHEEFEHDYTLLNWALIGIVPIAAVIFLFWR